MKDSLYLKKHMWLIFFIAVWCLTGLIDKAESGNKVISLNVTKTQLEKILITKSAEVQLSNDSFTIIQVASGKRMLSVEGLKPSASLSLAFERTGTYIACYSENRKKVLNKSTCLQIDVVGLRSI